MANINPRDQSSEWTFLETVEGAGVLSPSVDLGHAEMHFGNPEAGLNSDGEHSNLLNLVDNTRQYAGRTPDSQRRNQVRRSPRTRSDVSLNAAAAAAVNHFSTDDEEEIELFAEKPSVKLYCSLCHKVLREPVIVSCGHTFCKRCVIYQENINCPVDNIKLSVVMANLAVAEQIGELLVHCRFGVEPVVTNGNSSECPEQYQVNPHGCPVTVRASAKREHEAECDYKPVQCPNNPDCPVMLKKELAGHLSRCDHALCPKHQFGCEFHGTTTDLASHVEHCPYEAVKHYISRTEDQFGELVKVLQHKDQEISFLRAMLGQLSNKVDSLQTTLEGYVDRVESFNTEISTMHDKLQVVLSNQAGAFDPHQIFKCKGTFVGHTGPVWCLCVHQDYLFSGSSDKTIKVWDTSASYKCLKTLEGHQGIVLSLTVAGNRLFSGSQDCQIRVWNLDTFEQEKTIVTHEHPFGTLVTARGMLFGGSLKVIKVWNVSTMQLKGSITGLNHWVRALATSHNYLYGGSYQTIKVWDLETLDCVQQLETPGGSVYSIAITSHHILCGTYENCIHVWELDTYTQVATLVGHLGTVYALAVLNTASGTKIFSASYDRSLRVWSMDNMICTQTLVRHEGSVACLAVSKGQIFSGAMDSSVKVWR